MQFLVQGTVDNVYAPRPTEQYPDEKVFITIRTPYHGDFALTAVPSQVSVKQLNDLRAAAALVEVKGTVRGRLNKGTMRFEVVGDLSVKPLPAVKPVTPA